MTPVLNPVAVCVGALAGLALGGLYFGGLWWSVARLKKVERKKLFLFISWVSRSVLLCAGLYGLAVYDARALLSGAAGLLAARFAIVRFVKRNLAQEKGM